MSFVWAALIARHQARALSSCVPKSLGSPMLQLSRTSQRSCLAMSTSVDLEELNEKIKLKGDEIRQLKADGIEKAALAPHIEELLSLKSQLPPDENEEPKKVEKKKPEKKAKGPAPNKKMKEMSESELRMNRLAKVDAMRDANVEPFEYSYDVTHSATKLASEYDGRLDPGEEDESADVAVAGRIMTRRVFGKLAFFTLQDESGTIQLQFDKERLGDSFKVRRMFWGMFPCPKFG